MHIQHGLDFFFLEFFHMHSIDELVSVYENDSIKFFVWLMTKVYLNVISSWDPQIEQIPKII